MYVIFRKSKRENKKFSIIFPLLLGYFPRIYLGKFLLLLAVAGFPMILTSCPLSPPSW